ncbi:MAG: fumarylacetoacetate hydrolase family protein [bacterium]|nr:fumarylacetoacetate hydrolase family protein [bacterium]
MVLDPIELLARIAEEVAQNGMRSPMPIFRGGEIKYYPLAKPGPNGTGLLLPAGSILLTGTPEGVALAAPRPVGLVLRGLLEFRGPFEQFRLEELERAERAEPGGYLSAGDVVHTSIDGLGSQRWTVSR